MNMNSILSTRTSASHFSTSSGASANPMQETSFSAIMGKMNQASTQQKKLDQLAETDFEQYQKTMLNQDLASCHSIDRLLEIGQKYNLDKIEFKDVELKVDKEKKAITIGKMEPKKNVIHVGTLSNGYTFSFNRDNITDVSKVIDLFTPEDINKILNAITEYNMVQKTNLEIDEAGAAAFL